MANKSWSDLSSSQKQVRGSTRWWSLAVMVQPVGPVAYFPLGRR